MKPQHHDIAMEATSPDLWIACPGMQQAAHRDVDAMNSIRRISSDEKRMHDDDRIEDGIAFCILSR
jgi:hypothetical protein